MIPGVSPAMLAVLRRQTEALMTERVQLIGATGNVVSRASVQTDRRVTSLESGVFSQVMHYQWIYVLIPTYTEDIGSVSRIIILESQTAPDFVGEVLDVMSLILEPGPIRRYRCQRGANA